MREELAVAQENARQAPQPILASTAFIVAWINGEVIVTADLDAPIITDHYPTPDEILGAAAILVADRTAERTAALSAEGTVGLIEHKQREAVEKMQAAQQKAMGEQLLAQERSGKGRG